MDKQNDIKKPGFFDYLMPLGLLTLSYVLLCYLPCELTIKGWIVFGVSAFLFCLGYFGLIQIIPEPKSATGAVVRKLIMTTLAVAMFAFGLYYVYRDHGSEKSVVIAILLLIQCVVMCGFGSSDKCDELLSPKLMKFLNYVLMAAMIVAGIWFFAQEIIDEAGGSSGRVEVAAILWGAAGTLWYSRHGSDER
jgi:hypothetical protein